MGLYWTYDEGGQYKQHSDAVVVFHFSVAPLLHHEMVLCEQLGFTETRLVFIRPDHHHLNEA